MADDIDKELWAIFDAVESPEETQVDNSPDCVELAALTTRYEKQNLIGQGGIKKVWAATDNCSKREIAYAEPRDGLHPLFYDLLLEEAWLTASLQHPNIIKVHDVGSTEQKRPYFTMDLKRGLNLAQWREEKNSYEIDQCLDIVLKVCDAIEHAHSVKILHLDIKPENIQLESFSEVVVCDWGLARKTDDALAASAEETAELDSAQSTIGGTPGFMAPEQTEKKSQLNESTDVYGLGALLYFIISGKRPVDGKDVFTLIKATQNGDITPIKQHYSKIPAALNQIIMKCLSLKPEQRYQDVRSLSDDIRAFQRLQPTECQKSSIIQSSWLFYKRHHLLFNLSLCSLLLILSGSWWFSQQIEREVNQKKAEKQRADDAEKLVGKTQTELEGMAEDLLLQKDLDESTKKARSKEINDITSLIKARTMYVKTIAAVNAMEQLSKISLTLDPGSHMAWHQMAEVHFIKLNTKMTKRILKHYTPEAPELLKVFLSCPEVDFSDKRPSRKDLIDFIGAMEYNSYGHILAQRIILYNFESRKRRHKSIAFKDIVKAYFEAGSQKITSFEFILNEEERALILNGASPNPEITSPRLFTVSCLDLDKLILKGNFCTLTGLLQTTIKVLDVSEHAALKFTLNNLYNHPTIETIIIKKGMYDSKTLVNLKSQFEVIER